MKKIATEVDHNYLKVYFNVKYNCNYFSSSKAYRGMEAKFQQF